MLANQLILLWCSVGVLAVGILLLISTYYHISKQNAWVQPLAMGLISLGFLFLIAYTLILWSVLRRPPMRTTGETRLWYSIFVLLISFIVYAKWRYKVLVIGGAFFALMFTTINLAHPDLFNKNLPPALQSLWFIPHVGVYMLAYSILGMSCLTAMCGLVSKRASNTLSIADNLVYIGYGFLTIGMIFGALWAKEAWGHYWAWDPKETWAMITWLAYMLYIHYRLCAKHNTRQALWILVLAFLLLLICWFGLNYMNSANGSIHTY